MNKLVVVAFLFVLLAGCASSKNAEQTAKTEITVALIKTDFGEIAIELFEKDAPKTCANFTKLAEQKFYDNLTFHRVVKDFVIQGGCPKGDGTGGPGWTIPLEITPHKHIPGAVGMARAQEPDTAGSQFYICCAQIEQLDGNYCVFGQVIRGMDVVRKIENVEVEPYFIGGTPLHRPKEPVYIRSIRIVKEKK